MSKKNEDKSKGEINDISKIDSSLKKFPVVAIGSSAGGFDALKKFFKAMPDNCGMAFVLVQHLDPNHESSMVELMSRYTP